MQPKINKFFKKRSREWVQISLGWVAEFWRSSLLMASISFVKEEMRSSPDNEWEDHRVGNMRRVGEVWGSLWKRKRLVIWKQKGSWGNRKELFVPLSSLSTAPKKWTSFHFEMLRGFKNEWSWIKCSNQKTQTGWMDTKTKQVVKEDVDHLGLDSSRSLESHCQQGPLLPSDPSFVAGFLISLPQLLGLEVWRDCRPNSNRDYGNTGIRILGFGLRQRMFSEGTRDIGVSIYHLPQQGPQATAHGPNLAYCLLL